ncbi:MAG: hypothetical protein QM733_20330 [Ilumatobacteraceae bacterium]
MPIAAAAAMVASRAISAFVWRGASVCRVMIHGRPASVTSIWCPPLGGAAVDASNAS